MRKVTPIVVIVDRPTAARFAAVVKKYGSWADAFFQWRQTTAPYLVFWQGATDCAHVAAPAHDAQLRETLQLCATDLGSVDFQWTLFVEDQAAMQQLVRQAALTGVIAEGNA